MEIFDQFCKIMKVDLKAQFGKRKELKKPGVRIQTFKFSWLIYYWDIPNDTIYMLFIYKKSKQEDLTPEQLKKLRNLVKEWLQ